MRSWAVLVAGLLAVLPLRAELPSTYDEFAERHRQIGKVQAEVLRLWFDACFVYMNPETRDEGRRMLQHLTVPLRDFDDWDRETTNQNFVERLQKEEFQHIWRSYAIGAEPDNGYAMDPDDYQLRIAFDRADRFQRGWEIGLVSSGAPKTQRPVYLKRNVDDGLWYVSAFANLYVNVPPPT